MAVDINNLLKLAEQFEKVAKKSKDKKLDPGAKVRNRGTVCVPAEKAKDHKDHFPINDIDQARNAKARVMQYDKVPSWYDGSLKGLQDLVSRKVHSKYPSIGKEKKSSLHHLFSKYANNTAAFVTLINQHETTAPVVQEFANALSEAANRFLQENDINDPKLKRIHSLLLNQAQIISDVVPEIQYLDDEIKEAQDSEEM